VLEEIRKLYGYTQEELAGKIGISQNFFTQIETGASKSAPSIAKLSEVLQVKKSLLLLQGEYIEYPFLSDFYVFNLIEQGIVHSYKFIADLICSKSDFIDAIFLLSNPTLPGYPKTPWGVPIQYILIRDDRDTIFLVKRHIKKRRFPITRNRQENREIEVRTFPLGDSFRRILHSLGETPIYETTMTVPEDLYKKIETGVVKRDDVLPFFPNADYFYKQYEAHKRIKER
jgi:transcriptional regulator with XRE-family HTH domain